MNKYTCPRCDQEGFTPNAYMTCPACRTFFYLGDATVPWWKR